MILHPVTTRGGVGDDPEWWDGTGRDESGWCFGVRVVWGGSG